MVNQQQNPEVTKPAYEPNQRQSSDMQTSAYFKLRALAAQLRPHFMQVLQTPDFRDCQAAHEVRLQMKLMVDLYKQMIAETEQAEKFISEHKPMAADSFFRNSSSAGLEAKQKPDIHQAQQWSYNPFDYSSLDKSSSTTGDRQSYVVGGSVFGWNYITYLGDKSVYYGVTKESFRSSQKKPFGSDE